MTTGLSTSVNTLDDDDLVFYDAPETISTPAVTATIANIPSTVRINDLVNIAISAGGHLPRLISDSLGVGSSIATLSISHAGISGRLVAPSKGEI